MGIIKKAIGNAIINSVTGNPGGASKNDVKLAKLEMKKAREEKKTQKEAELDGKVDACYVFTKDNFAKIKSTAISLKNEVSDMNAEIHDIDTIETNSRKEHKEQQKEKNKIKESVRLKLEYLYLINDYLINLMNYAYGFSLKTAQKDFVTRFVPYFNGVPIIENERLMLENGDSVADEFKSIGHEFAGMFAPNASIKKVHVYDYLTGHESSIENFIIPQIESSLESLEKAIKAKEENSEEKTENEEKTTPDSNNHSINQNRCPSCNAELDDDDKFCSQCGTSIVATKPLFCSECGAKLKSGVKFCSSCGQKVE